MKQKPSGHRQEGRDWFARRLPMVEGFVGGLIATILLIALWVAPPPSMTWLSTWVGFVEFLKSPGFGGLAAGAMIFVHLKGQSDSRNQQAIQRDHELNLEEKKFRIGLLQDIFQANIQLITDASDADTRRKAAALQKLLVMINELPGTMGSHLLDRLADDFRDAAERIDAQDAEHAERG